MQIQTHKTKSDREGGSNTYLGSVYRLWKGRSWSLSCELLCPITLSSLHGWESSSRQRNYWLPKTHPNRLGRKDWKTRKILRDNGVPARHGRLRLTNTENASNESIRKCQHHGRHKRRKQQFVDRCSNLFYGILKTDKFYHERKTISGLFESIPLGRRDNSFLHFDFSSSDEESLLYLKEIHQRSSTKGLPNHVFVVAEGQGRYRTTGSCRMKSVNRD
jgi:hypothetical protein